MALESPYSGFVENTSIFDGSHFVLLPTIGPLVDGHAMLASKQHYDSLSAMPEEAIAEFLNIIKKLTSKFQAPDNILIIEHGSSDGQSGGACTVHTHIHLIPNYGNLYNILDGILPILKIELHEISSLQEPYILSMNSNGTCRIYEAYNAHSQMMRKAICNHLDRHDSDWKANFNRESILKTIGFWLNRLTD